MNSAKSVTIASVVLNAVLAVVLIVTTATLIRERSQDTIRFKVHSSEVYGYDFAPTVYYLARITGKEPIAEPLNGSDVNATEWQVTFE